MQCQQGYEQRQVEGRWQVGGLGIFRLEIMGETVTQERGARADTWHRR